MKYIYFFGADKAEGNASLKNTLGGKGSNLHEMTRLGMPVPPGFTISTDVCRYYYSHNKSYPKGLREEVIQNLAKVESVMGRKFGASNNPLLFSVRSGARVSMPGMMDTVLNIGLNDETIKGLIKQTQDPRFAYDCERRLIQMYGGVVLGVPHTEFENLLTERKEEKKVSQDTELTAKDWQELISQYKIIIKKYTHHEFPSNPIDQLWGAISAVFESWDTKRAIEYRRINAIPDDWGTAVNVQAMVYGNMGENSATGVAFTRNPATGENVFYGEWLRNAQGEDVVAGIRTPHPINIFQKGDSKAVSLEEEMPAIYNELLKIRKKLEQHYLDMQDIEFTAEKGKLWMLQTRNGKRTPLSAVKVAVDMAKERLITEQEAVGRVEPSDIDFLLHPIIDPKAKIEVISQGLPASPGAASGKVVFSPEEAVALKEKNEPSILVRFETSPEDIAGMASCEGILTQRGGMTSHAAVVARGMGKPCIVGCESITIDYKAQEFYTKGKNTTIAKGDFITIDGGTGRVIKGKVPTIRASLKGEFGELLKYADKIRKLGVRANADTPESARTARKFGAEGIGLCRTEHMFFGEDRIKAVREMILADTVEERRRALSKLLPMQREDFKGIFREMDGYPVIIRTLDPPLHEFLPHKAEQIRDLSKEMGVPESKLKEKMASLSEANPMLGHRGCRLGISYPEITEMQARAVIEAACEVQKEGIKVIPEIMIPVTSEAREIENQRKVIDKVAKDVIKKHNTKLRYFVGTMIEIPRAALTADQIARTAEFFSYGTNDLTQTTFGFSRDDIGKILPDYIAKGILKYDPFQRIDEEGVGALVRIGIERGRSTNPDLEIGICGEHGGEPHSVEFCHRVGMNYVSCSPYRVPIARLAAAHAVIKENRKQK
ncbi:pyruvate, phosphate dikinase [candidate division WOR-3 bacterium]|nr:pyruvate, phosphate dikinase [candidate division WOR-3 bacterium]